MKHISPFLITLFALCLGVANAWADTKTVTVSSFTETQGTLDNNISYSAAQGGGTAAPTVKNNVIQLYQNSSGKGGGTITITAKDGCTIQSVVIGSSMNTSVAYTVNTSSTKSTTASLAANGKYTTPNLSVSSITFYCMGKDKNSRLYVNYLSVTYESATTYSINLNQPQHGEGTISADKTKAAEGDKVTLTATPNAGYYLTGWTVLDGEAEEISVTDNQFTMPASNVEVDGVFASCTPLSAPTGLNASATTYNAATFTWDKVDNATKYEIIITPPAFGGSATYTTTGTETTYTATGLSPETTYTWTVKAIGNGTTYCDSEESAEGTFTTPAKPKYTITWSSPSDLKTTKVTQDEKIGTLPAEPNKPQGCPDKVFMGWSATNIGNTGTDVAPTFITAETVPSGDVTYYAVFATKEGSAGIAAGTILWAENFDHFATNTPSTAGTGSGTTIYGDAAITYTQSSTSTKGYNDKLAGGTAPELLLAKSNGTWTIDGIKTGSATEMSLTFVSNKTSGITLSSTTSGITISGNFGAWTIKNDGTSETFNLTFKNTTTGNIRIDNIELKVTSGTTTTYTDYVTNCIECTAPMTAFALIVADATLNLGEDGKAMTTFSTTDGNGGKIDYVVNPTTGADIDKDNKTITFTQTGTYTLTAQQDLNTTADGTTYCGSRDSKTITVTSTPVLYFTATPADPIAFPEVECGGNTPLSQKQQISLQGYNLTGDVSVAVTGDYKIARTASAALSDYTTELTLPKTTAGKINATYSSVYVLSCPPAQSSSATSGTLTITTDKGNTLTVNLSTPTVTCKEYTLTLNDRGSKSNGGSYYAGAPVSQPADPTGVCTEPINYVFDGWATAEVANGSTTYTPISFPYTMPKGNTTLYAVYRYVENPSDDYKQITTEEALTDGEYLIVGNSGSTYRALSSTEGSTTGQYDYETVTPSSNVITTTDELIIWNISSTKDGSYTIEQGGQYLNINNNVLCMEAKAIPYTVSVSSNKFTFKTTDKNSTSSTILSYYHNGGIFNAFYSANTVYLYQRQGEINYTTSPVCGPYIKATGDVAITSGKGIWVESVTPLTISAKNLDKNEDGENGTPASVTITATVTEDAADKGFSIKTVGTLGAGSAKTPVELARNCTDATYDGALTVVYTPTTDDVKVEGKIALRVYKSNGSTTYATDTIVVRGRSLPAEFVLAAKTEDGWVALPSDLAVGSTGTLKYPYAISVDDASAPTKATEAPETAIYMSADRSAKNTVATAIRFKNANGHYLQGSTSDGQTNVWLSNQNSEQAQSWELRSADFAHYFVRMHASEVGRYLSYDATQGKIGNYKQEASLHILPVEKTCVRFDAPKIDVHALTSTSATLLWEAIAGVTDYEYSLDDGITWQTCTDVQIIGTAIQWTLSGLETQKQYIVWVRAKAAVGKTNCSDYDSKTFTTTSCDDVPTDLWSSATANSVTITWNAKAATATVKIYLDDKGENEVQSAPNQSSPAKIVGLTPNTRYYFQVLADGSCASAIDDFWTESNEVSIVEWEKEAVIVDINTDVTDADDVSILVENQTTHGSNNKNIADDLFFSKYYEATGQVKLVAIFNGTKDTLSLKDIVVSIGQENTKGNANTRWDKSISLQSRGKFKVGYIAPNEEIILWCKGNSSVDKQITSCVDGKMDVSIMNEEVQIVFGGRQTIALSRNGKIIDIMGAVSTNDADITMSFPVKGNCVPTWGDITDGGSSNRTWCGTGYSIVDKTTEIQLSMNRCLLVRSNKVKSGANAVKNNVGAFNTLTKDEWLGRQVLKGNDDGVTESCEGFAYVADFNYNDYYTTYDSVAKLEIKGNRNADGTYTIPVPRMDTMACTNMRLQLKKAGVVIASREYKVPIVVDKSINTQNTTYFGGDKLTDEVCATCDVVVRDKARLEHVEGGKQQFREMYVYAGSTFFIPEGQKMTLDKVRMFAKNDTVSYAIINNSDATDAAISVKEVSHIKRIDGKYWYPFSLPYDCNIADIDQLSGQTLGVYGEDWGIKFYDGESRQKDGNSTTHYGEVSKYWTMMKEDGVLKAYTGYIIGLFYPDENLMRSVNFPPANISAYTESATSKTTTITNWPDNLTAQPRHHGWNFVGSPYISLFGAATGEGLYNDQLKMGWTDAYGEQQDKEHIYVSIPDGGNSNTYTQALASGVTIKPFTAYFVQALDPKDGQSHTLSLTYSKANRHLQAAQARAQNAEPLILAELDIRCGALHDNTGVLVSDVYSTDYEIGDDLYKMYAAAAKPQLYTTDASSEKMAYQALPDLSAHAVPLGIYLPAAGDYTLSLNRSVSRVAAAEAVYLLHDGKVVADLLQTDYTLTAAARGTLSGYTLDIRRAPKMPTDILPAAGDAPYLMVRDGVLTVANLPAGAMVQVYDVLGRVLLRTTATEQSFSVPAAQTGVYTVLITTDNLQTVLKTLLR